MTETTKTEGEITTEPREKNEKFETHVRSLQPRTMKTSKLLAQYTALCLRGGIGDGPNYALVQDKLKELEDEIDRRLPGPGTVQP